MQTFAAVLPLIPHPDTPPTAIASVTCSVSWQAPGQWCFDYIVSEPIEALRLPRPVTPARADGLWQRTCFELFLRSEGAATYYEFNFSPSGEWAAYRFDGYRAGMAELKVAAPRVTTSDPSQFALSMKRYLEDLGIDPETTAAMVTAGGKMEPGPVGQYALTAMLDDSSFGNKGSWLAAISAVIEETDGTKSYWALAHPPGRPDFHHSDCFALELAAPDQS